MLVIKKEIQSAIQIKLKKFMPLIIPKIKIKI